jgi:hypothetical protein
MGLSGAVTAAGQNGQASFSVIGVLGPLFEGKDPLKINGTGYQLFASISTSATPIVSTSTSATYSLPAGAVSSLFGPYSVQTNTVPWTMTITLGSSSDTLVFTGPLPDGSAFTSTSTLAVGSFPSSVLSNPVPFSPSPQDVSSGTATVAYSLGCVVGVAAGSDYFTTGTGTSVKILNKVHPLTGVPLDPDSLGNADTIVERAYDALFAVASIDAVTPDIPPTVTIPITLTALQLTGTYGTLPDHACTMNITIQGTPLSTGTMTLTVDAAGTGGTFTSSFDVYYTVKFTAVSPNTRCPGTITGNHTLTLLKPKGEWSTTPLPNEVLVVGAYPDPNANQHTGLPAGFVDFYATGVAEHLGQTVKHFVCEALTTSTGAACK